MRRSAILALLLFASVCDIYAEEQGVVELEQLVVTPARIETNAGSVASSVTSFTEKKLEKRGLYTLMTALKQDYSLDMVQTGGYGGTASLFIRGANSGQTRVMIDGIRVYDPISADGSFDPAYLTLDNVERIEIVRGAQSSLYGSDAIGGVINIITKKGAGKPKLSIFEEFGTYYTRREGLGLNGEKDKLQFAISSSHFRTRGFSRASEERGNKERDPYENNAYSLRTGYDISDKLALGLIGRYTYARYSYDDSGGVGGDDDNREGWTKQAISSVILNHKIWDEFEQKIQLSWMGNFRRDFDESDSVDVNEYLRDWFYGQTQQADWQGTIKASEFDSIIGGFNYLREKGESYFFSVDPVFGTSESIFPKTYASTKGYFLENRLNIDEKFTSSISYRIEDHSRFNTNETYKIDALYALPKTNTKIEAAFGTGFKTPTLYQLYAPADAFFGGGNVNLQPEESETFEAGFEQPLLDNKINYGFTYFHNNFKNLIDAVFNPDTFLTDKYQNVSKARSFGFENRIEIKPRNNFKICANYTWLDTENKETHDELLRRPKNKLNFNFDYSPFNKLNLNLNVSYVGHRQDVGNLLLKRYTKVDFSAYYDINANTRIYSRIENLLDEKYEEVTGYGTAGFSIFSGIKLAF
ncbi:MAG: TonB-dependent receptor [Candidatus Omnitrophota bacterium]